MKLLQADEIQIIDTITSAYRMPGHIFGGIGGCGLLDILQDLVQGGSINLTDLKNSQPHTVQYMVCQAIDGLASDDAAGTQSGDEITDLITQCIHFWGGCQMERKGFSFQPAARRVKLEDKDGIRFVQCSWLAVMAKDSDLLRHGKHDLSVDIFIIVVIITLILCYAISFVKKYMYTKYQNFF